MGWGWIGLGLLHMALFWGLVIFVFAVFVKWLGGPDKPFTEIKAMDILKARYAKGELTLDEFERMKRELED